MSITLPTGAVDSSVAMRFFARTEIHVTPAAFALATGCAITTPSNPFHIDQFIPTPTLWMRPTSYGGRPPSGIWTMSVGTGGEHNRPGVLGASDTPSSDPAGVGPQDLRQTAAARFQEGKDLLRAKDYRNAAAAFHAAADQYEAAGDHHGVCLVCKWEEHAWIQIDPSDDAIYAPIIDRVTRHETLRNAALQECSDHLGLARVVWDEAENWWALADAIGGDTVLQKYTLGDYATANAHLQRGLAAEAAMDDTNTLFQEFRCSRIRRTLEFAEAFGAAADLLPGELPLSRREMCYFTEAITDAHAIGDAPMVNALMRAIVAVLKKYGQNMEASDIARYVATLQGEAGDQLGVRRSQVTAETAVVTANDPEVAAKRVPVRWLAVAIAGGEILSSGGATLQDQREMLLRLQRKYVALFVEQMAAQVSESEQTLCAIVVLSQCLGQSPSVALTDTHALDESQIEKLDDLYQNLPYVFPWTTMEEERVWRALFLLMIGAGKDPLEWIDAATGFFEQARQAGVTTVADLHSVLQDPSHSFTVTLRQFIQQPLIEEWVEGLSRFLPV